MERHRKGNAFRDMNIPGDPRLLDADQREALRDILNSALRLAAPNTQAQSNVIDGEYEEVENA